MLGMIEKAGERRTENEMVGWHHRLDGHEFEQAPGVGDRQGALVCCIACGKKEWDTVVGLKEVNNELYCESFHLVFSNLYGLFGRKSI